MEERRKKSQLGQSILEFAFVLPILLLLVLGTVDLGRALHIAYQINRISREGANLVSRGAGVTDREITLVLADLEELARPSLDIARKGVIIVSIIEGRGGGEAQIIQQVIRGGIRVRSRAGGSGDLLDRERLEWVLHGETLQEGQIVALVEAYYQFDLITPIYSVFGLFDPRNIVFGSQAVFFFS